MKKVKETRLEEGDYVVVSDDSGGVNIVGPFANADAAFNYGEKLADAYGSIHWFQVTNPDILFFKP